MRKPFTKEQIKQSPENGVFEDNAIIESVFDDAESIIGHQFSSDNITKATYDKAMDAVQQLSTAYSSYLMQNDPQTIDKPTQGTFEEDVKQAEKKVKEALGEHLGGEMIKNIQQSLDTKYEEALNVKSPKRG